MKGVPVVAYLVLLVVVADLATLFGIGLVLRKLRLVKRLTRAANALSRTQLTKRVERNVRISVLSGRQLSDLLVHVPRKNKVKRFLNYPFGRLVMIVHSSDAPVRRIARELQLYALVVAVLFIVGTLVRLARMTKLNIIDLLRDIGDNPLHFLDILALAAAISLLLRLVSEILRLAELLEAPR